MTTDEYPTGISMFPTRNALPMQPGPRILRSLSYRWLTAPTFLVLFAALLSLAGVQAEHRMAAVMAIVNIALTAMLSRRFLAVNPVTGLMPTFFIVPTCLLSAVSSLYFCVFNPDFAAFFGGGRWLYLRDNAFFQCVILAHLVTFSLPWLLFMPPSKQSLPYGKFIEAAKAVARPSFMAFTICVLSMLVVRLAQIDATTPVGYVVYGFFRYMHSIPMVSGMAWHVLLWPFQWQVLGVLGINTLVNTATNSRYYAFIPPLLFGAGFMFLSRVSLRRKYVALVASVAVLAVVMVIGNASRRIGGGLWRGGVEGLQRQYEVLSNRSEKILDVRWGDEIFGRMFFNGGHQIVVLMPEEHMYKEWVVPLYIGEVVTQGLLPRGLATTLIEPYHEEKSTLLKIGHRLTKTHSVERSYVGAAWELGGWVPLLTISFLAGGFLLGMAGVIHQLFLKWPKMAVLAFVAECDAIMWSINEGLPSMAHECVYSVVVMGVLYLFVRILGKLFFGESFAGSGVQRPLYRAF